jgi:hypothetical protein
MTTPSAHVRAREDLTTGPTVSEEIWILRRLSVPALFAGTTTLADRRSRLRAHLIAHGLGDARAGMRDGREETWAELFCRAYREPLGDAP